MHARIKSWIMVVLHIALWSSIGVVVHAYATASQEFPFLRIQAAQEEYLAQKVFAQFVYTQTITFDRPARITELVVPMYVPQNSMPLKIRLFQEGRPIYSWVYPPEGEGRGVVEARLPFAAPTMLGGSLEVRFDGSAIDHDHQAQAPRLFIEPKNEGYRGGNYRIASNEKWGDISLGFMETKTNYEIFRDALRERFRAQIPRILFMIAGILLLFQFPRIVVDLFDAIVRSTKKAM